MSGSGRLVLFVVFAMTGVSALTLQVVWQRVLSLHAGIDLLAATTVVTAFMAGLGIGSLAGGWIADRSRARGSLLVFAIANVGIAAYAWSSLWLFYDVYRQLASRLDSAFEVFAFHFLLLCVPTALMGLSLPLLARSAVSISRDIAPIVGRLYAVNTIGAALGAVVTGWWLVGTFGFVTTVRIAACLNLSAAAIVLGVRWRLAGGTSAHPASPSTSETPASAQASMTGRIWPWFILYGLTGAVAIGLEVVYFRVVDAVMRNNSYTFATVLAMYLGFFGLGAMAGARLVGRSRRPDVSFLFLQFMVGVTTLAGVIWMVNPVRSFGFAEFVSRYFSGPGFMHGGYSLDTAEEAGRLLYAHVVAPIAIMGIPVLLMGASFPFIQALVSRHVDSLGRRTGLLMFSNICGNVIGGALTGFVLFDRFGTTGALQVLAGVLVLPGLAAAIRMSRTGTRIGTAVAVAGAMGGLITVFPSNDRFWAFFHGVAPELFTLEEDRACVTALIEHPDNTFLYINALWQNGEPYDPFHILIGLVPSLMHERPERALAIGLGIGSTAYSIAQDPRVKTVDTVEICGGQKRLIRKLAERGSKTSSRLVADSRVRMIDGDGRRWMLSGTDPYDIIVVDAVRPDSGYAGNLYSIEFYELVASRLADDGLFVQWIPTERVFNSVRRVFPHIVRAEVPEYFSSPFLVASMNPIRVDHDLLQRRLAALDLESSFHPDQIESLTAFFARDPFSAVLPDAALENLPDHRFNRDLHPRDEYFLNEPR